MFDNPTDNHTDIEVPLYYKLRFTKLKIKKIRLEPVAEDETHFIFIDYFIGEGNHIKVTDNTLRNKVINGKIQRCCIW